MRYRTCARFNVFGLRQRWFTEATLARILSTEDVAGAAAGAFCTHWYQCCADSAACRSASPHIEVFDVGSESWNGGTLCSARVPAGFWISHQLSSIPCTGYLDLPNASGYLTRS